MMHRDPLPSRQMALELRIGRVPVVIPAEHVRSLVECELIGPLPLSRPWVSGVAVMEGRLLVSLALRQSSTGHRLPVRRRAKVAIVGELNAETGGARRELAIEITAAAALVEVEWVAAIAGRQSVSLPGWVREATLVGARRVGFIDVPVLLADSA